MNDGLLEGAMYREIDVMTPPQSMLIETRNAGHGVISSVVIVTSIGPPVLKLGTSASYRAAQ